MKLKHLAILGCLCVTTGAAWAVQTEGAQLTLSASSQVVVPNDEAEITFSVTAQNKEASQAASAVNTQMKAGTQLVQSQDRTAKLSTSSYTSYPVYTSGTARQGAKVDSWRVEQTLTVKTSALDKLPELIAAGQKVMTVSNVRFGLSAAAQKQHEAELTQKAYQALENKINVLTQAMGRNAQDATIESIQVDDDGMRINAPVMLRAAAMKQDAVAEPDLESGESTLNMRLSSKVKLK